MNEATTQKALAIAELNPIITDIAAFEGTVESIDIVDEETQASMADLVKFMTQKRKRLEDKRVSLVKPLNGVVKEINTLFKAPRDQIDRIVLAAKSKMKRFAEAQLAIEREKKRQEEEAARQEREEAERLKKALESKAHSEGVQEVADKIVEDAEAKVEKAEAREAKPAVVRGESANVVVSRTWKAEVVDKLELVKAVAEGKVSPDVLEPNMRALTGIARDTKLERTWAGVRFFEDVSTVVR